MVAIPADPYDFHREQTVGLDPAPPIGAEPKVRSRAAWAENKEFRWWLAVMLAAIVLSLLAFAVVR